MLRHCDYQLYLLYRDNNIIGRIAVYIDIAANEWQNEKIGSFGHYECIDDDEAALTLLETAQTWLINRDMKTMRGPWNFVSQDMGLITEGFDLPPVIMSSYNPPYYNEQMKKFGLTKSKDLLVYNTDTSKGYTIPERFISYTDKIAKRYHITVRQINMKNLIEDAHTIVRLTNESLKNNWGYYPIPDSEAEAIAADLKMIIHPEAVLIAEADGKAVGYVITLPDVNVILKDLNGRLFPFGIFKLLSGIKKIKHYRIWAMGILEPFQKKGVSILLFRRLNEAIAHKGIYVEANWVLEDNALMNNAMKNLKFDLVKRYRIYQKDLDA